MHCRLANLEQLGDLSSVMSPTSKCSDHTLSKVVTSVKVVYERVIRLVDYAALLFTSAFDSVTSSRCSMVM